MKFYQTNKKKAFVFSAFLLLPLSVSAQYLWQEDVDPGELDLGKDIHYNVEMQGSFSKGKTPLWLNANKHGLSSLEKNNGYLRGSVIRPLGTDSARRWVLIQPVVGASVMAWMWQHRFIIRVM